MGRCFNSLNYGLDISTEERVCLEFIDGRNPSEVIFYTVGQLQNYLREYFYKRDFVNDFTRKQLVSILQNGWTTMCFLNPSGFSEVRI
jgi:hypothetical protein